MATLKTTIKVESTDLFPTPVNFTSVNNNAVNGTFSTFGTIAVSTGAQALNIATVDNTAYIYLKAATTNAVTIQVRVNGGSTFSSLAAGDVAFFPYGDGSGGINDIEVLTASGTATLEYFIGEKA